MTTNIATPSNNVISIWLIRHSIREDADNRVKAVTDGKNIPLESDCAITFDGAVLAHTNFIEVAKHVKNGMNKIYVSPYKRCLETSYILSSHFPAQCPITIDSRLSEGILKEHLNGMTPTLPLPLASYLDQHKVPIGESIDNLNSRCVDFMNSLIASATKESHSTISVVTHGTIINTILKQLLGDGYKFSYTTPPDKYKPGYCDYVCVHYDRGTKNWTIGQASFAL